MSGMLISPATYAKALKILGLPDGHLLTERELAKAAIIEMRRGDGQEAGPSAAGREHG